MVRAWRAAEKNEKNLKIAQACRAKRFALPSRRLLTETAVAGAVENAPRV